MKICCNQQIHEININTTIALTELSSKTKSSTVQKFIAIIPIVNTHKRAVIEIPTRNSPINRELQKRIQIYKLHTPLQVRRCHYLILAKDLGCHYLFQLNSIENEAYNTWGADDVEA